MRWVPVDGGFRFEGLPPKTLPEEWLAPTTGVATRVPLLLGPEPMIAPQSVVLVSTASPDRRFRVATDGLRPFSVAAESAP